MTGVSPLIYNLVMRKWRWTQFGVQGAAFWCLIAAAVTPPSAAWATNSAFRITTLSNLPDKVSGGDVLVRIDVPDSLSMNQAAVKLNGRDITTAFHPDLVEHALIGLVAGLSLGQNRLEVFCQ